MEKKRKKMLYEVFKTNRKGRGLKALNDLHTGQTVLDESPVLCVLSNNLRRLFCSHCFRMNAQLLRCSGCRFARYCGLQCQRKAWKKHRNECKRFLEISPRVPTNLVRLMYRILEMKIADRDMSWFENLVSNVLGVGEARKRDFVAIIAVLGRFAGPEYMAKFTSFEIFDLFAKISCNSFSVCDGEMQPIGVGIYSMASMLNHSCSPNCVAVFNSTQLSVRALRKIKSGEELTISYTELLVPRKVRQKELLQQYCFACDCPKCQNPDENDSLVNALKCVNESCKNPVPETGKCSMCGSSRDLKQISDICVKSQAVIDEIKEMELNIDPVKALDLCENILKQQELILHPYHYLLIGVLDKAFDACVLLSKWNEALAYALRTMEPYISLYHKHHPNLGIQLFRIGKLQSFLGNHETGVSTLQKALAILEVTHGDEHPTLQQLREVLAEASEEYRQQRINSK